MPNLYLSRDPEEMENNKQATAEKSGPWSLCHSWDEWTVPAPEFIAPQPLMTDWSEGVQVFSVPLQEISIEDLMCPDVHG